MFWGQMVRKDYFRFHLICLRSNLHFNFYNKNYFPNLHNYCMVANASPFLPCPCVDRLFWTKSNSHHHYTAHNLNIIHINASQQFRFHNHMIRNANASLRLFFLLYKATKNGWPFVEYYKIHFFVKILMPLIFLCLCDCLTCNLTKTKLQILMPTNNSSYETGTLSLSSANASANNSFLAILTNDSSTCFPAQFSNKIALDWKMATWIVAEVRLNSCTRRRMWCF